MGEHEKQMRMKSLVGRRFAVGTKEAGARAAKKIAKVPIYATEAEAKSDWHTLAPKYRTQARLAEMMARVAPPGFAAGIRTAARWLDKEAERWQPESVRLRLKDMARDMIKIATE